VPKGRVKSGQSSILNSQFPIPSELTSRERRWFAQPLWRQALSALMIVALVFVTTPTEVQAQTFSPVFYFNRCHREAYVAPRHAAWPTPRDVPTLDSQLQKKTGQRTESPDRAMKVAGPATEM